MAFGVQPFTGTKASSTTKKKPTAFTKVTLPGPRKPGEVYASGVTRAPLAPSGPQYARPGAAPPPKPTPIAPPVYNTSGGIAGAAQRGDYPNPTVAGQTAAQINQRSQAVGGGDIATGQNGGTGSSNITGPLTGFASAFPADMIPYLYAEPENILQQVMRNQGQSPLTGNSGLYAAATPYMDALMSILPLAFGGKGISNQSDPLNWLAEQMGQGMKPGGAGIDFGSVLNALQSQMKNTSSATSQYFTAPGMNPLDQYAKAKEVLLGSASAGLPPQFQAALKNAMETAHAQYMGNLTTGKQAGNFLPWFLNSSYTQGYK